MNEYTPAYLAAIQNDLTTMQEAANRAAETIENSEEYKRRLHPYHNAAVATYNKLVSILLDLDRYQTTE